MQGKQIKSGAVESALNQFLQDERHLVFGFEKSDDGVNHKIFQKKLKNLSLFNPTFGANGALYLRRLFSKASQIVLLLRPCEIRAYTELTKLTQIERESVTAVSMDCFGARSLKDETEGIPVEMDGIRDYFKNPEKMRWACKVCRERRGVMGDAGLRIDAKGEFWVVPYTKKGEALVLLFEGELRDVPKDMLIGESPKAEKFQTDMANFAKDFSKCIMCKNCRDMCPVCYCIDCVFNGDEYLPKGDALLNKIFRTGALGMPQGKDMFHLIRMYHVSQTCVACGACEEACPQGIALTKYFKGISERLQGLFSYMSGRSFDEEIPYVSFVEDELKEWED
ncbi:MAG TPA: 4Fe-4S dicluster domain-containing protein [Syntrophorhabdaceae bacterium]|nr:4Fe-4S dicluster domain-containing protein [Syntrophorhabdaceae bacterium]